MSTYYILNNADLAAAIEVAHSKVVSSGTATPHFKTWQDHLKALTTEQAKRAAAAFSDSGDGK